MTPAYNFILTPPPHRSLERPTGPVLLKQTHAGTLARRLSKLAPRVIKLRVEEKKENGLNRCKSLDRKNRIEFWKEKEEKERKNEILKKKISEKVEWH